MNRHIRTGEVMGSFDRATLWTDDPEANVDLLNGNILRVRSPPAEGNAACTACACGG